MAIDYNLILQKQNPNPIGSLMGGIMSRQKMEEGKLKNKLLTAQIGEQENKSKLEAAKRQAASILSGINESEKFVQAGDFEGLNNYLMNREQDILSRNGDPSHTQNFRQELAEGPQEGETPEQFKQRIQNELRDERDDLYDSGLVQRSESEIKRLEELRSEARSRNKEIDANISFITDTEESLTNLAQQIKDGDRSAVSSFFVKLVKSQDPNSAVLAGEMLSAMNLEGLAETAFAVARGEASADNFQSALSAEIAGLNPENINIKDVLSTADSNLAGKKKALLDTYDINQETISRLSRGGRADVTSQTRSDRISALKANNQPMWYKFLPDESKPTPEGVGAWAAKYNMSEAEALSDIENRLAKKFGLLGNQK
jgi:hypothetical protein